MAICQITNEKIYPNAITTDKIANLTITNNDIGPSAITTDKVADNAITSVKIAPNTITNEDIADNTISSTQITDNNISSIDLLNEPGIAHLEDTSHVELGENSLTTYYPTTISCPSAGFVIASITFEGRIENGIGGSTFLKYDIHEASSSYSSRYNYNPGSGDRYNSISVQRTYTINGPGDYTFNLNAYKVGASKTTIWNVRFNLLFVPTAYGTVD